MKKFLLVATAMLVSMSGMSSNKVMKLERHAPKMKMEKKVSLGAFKSERAQLNAMNAFYSNNRKFAMKNMKKAENVSVTVAPAYAMTQYVFTGMDFYSANMVEGHSFSVIGNKVYFTPFIDRLGYVEGTIVNTENRMLPNGTAVKIDSISFDLTGIVGVYTDPNTNAETEIVLRNLQIIEGKLVSSNKMALGAYLYDESELYIPSIFGLCMGGDSEPIDPTVVAAYTDLFPADYLNQYISKANYTVTDAFDEAVYKGEAQVLLAGDYYVKGFDQASDESWICFTVDDDGMTAIIEPEQYIGSFGFYTDETYTTTQQGDVMTYAFTVTEKGYSGTEEGTTSFFVDNDEASQTTTITTTGMELYGGWVSFEKGGGLAELLSDIEITILYEPVYAGISNVILTKATSTEYFDLQGRKVNGNQKGLLIKKSTLSDGTVKSVKMLNK